MRSPEKEINKRIQVVGAILFERSETAPHRGKNLLLVQRKAGDVGEGLWEFPGGKIDPGESNQQAILREIEEELNLKINILDSLGKLSHSYPNLIVDLEIFITEIESGEIILREHQNKKWVKPHEIIAAELLEADRPFVQRLLNYLK